MATEVKCEVKEKIGSFGKLELRYVAWNGNAPKYDIRPWFTDKDGNEKCGKGVTLTGEELAALGDLINKLREEKK